MRPQIDMTEQYNQQSRPESLETVGDILYENWNETAQACKRYERAIEAALDTIGENIIPRDVLVRGAGNIPSTLVRFDHDAYRRPNVRLYTFSNALEQPHIDDLDPYRTCIALPDAEMEMEKPDGPMASMADLASHVLYGLTNPGAPEHNQLSIRRVELTLESREERGRWVKYYQPVTRHTLTYDHLPDGGIALQPNAGNAAVDTDTVTELHRLAGVLRRASATVNSTTEPLIFVYDDTFNPSYDFVPPLYAPDEAR